MRGVLALWDPHTRRKEAEMEPLDLLALVTLMADIFWWLRK